MRIDGRIRHLYHAGQRALVGITAFCFVAAGAAAEPAWLPPKGAVLWLDASDLNADSKRDTGQDGPVSEWKDKSGQGNDVSQSQPPRRPVRRNALWGKHDTVVFANHSLQIPKLKGLNPGDQPAQVFAVMKAAPQSGANPVLLDLPTMPVNAGTSKQYTSKRKGFWIGYRALAGTTGRTRLGIHVGDEAISRHVAWNGNPQLLDVMYAGNQRYGLYQNGQLAGRGRFQGANTFVGYEGGARFSLGQKYGSTSDATAFRGQIAELLIFNRPLNSMEQRGVATYLSRKYAITLKTADTHPNDKDLVFEAHIQPLLKARCGDCHSGKEPEARLKVDSLSSLLRGGTSGRAIVRGNANDSLLLHLVATGEMPPADSATRLTDGEYELIRRWLDAGARAKEKVDVDNSIVRRHEHWSFQRLGKVPTPRLATNGSERTAVDAFIRNKLKEKQLAMSPTASRVTLVRRAHLDLLGILPTTAEVDRFVADKRPDAWERLIDDLLASPHFGERWSRHWLDGAGYSDTLPLDNDQTIIKPGIGKWKYRDYVIRAFNNDKPFDQFLLEQLAGDELVAWRKASRLTDDMRDKLVATGFLRCSADFTDENELNTLGVRYDLLHRTSEMIAGNLLGLTMQCCKCHDHKFEPLPQRDYYRFTAIFSPALNPKAWLQPARRQLPGLGPAEDAELKAAVSKAERTKTSVLSSAQNRLLKKRAQALPEPIRADVVAALQKPEAQRNQVQKYLAGKFSALTKDLDKQASSVYTAEERQVLQKADHDIRNSAARRQQAIIQAVYDTGPPSPVHVFRRGNYLTPGASVSPGLFTVVAPFNASATARDALSSSGRRLALARQLTDWKSPAGALIARVRVNRVWQQLFGQGLVHTADNFGVSGGNPTHPELLEWLSGRFVAQRGRLKPLLRLLMNSAVYRQSAASPVAAKQLENARKADPTNQLLWRQRLRRLESEIVRDSMLVASGRLDRTVGGPPVGLVNRPDGMVIEANADKATRWRRSMYILQRRNYHLSVLAAFDQPLLTRNCTKRESSAVVDQSLMMLNDAFVLKQANLLADRVMREAATMDARIKLVFQLTLARRPSAEEAELCRQSLAKQQQNFQANKSTTAQATRSSLTQLCHMLFNTSEFLYVH